jgi:hypothetical protein
VLYSAVGLLLIADTINIAADVATMGEEEFFKVIFMAARQRVWRFAFDGVFHGLGAAFVHRDAFLSLHCERVVAQAALAPGFASGAYPLLVANALSPGALDKDKLDA